MSENGQGFELLNFLWARYPSTLDPATRMRRFLDYPFPIPGNCDFLQQLEAASCFQDRIKAAEAFEKTANFVKSPRSLYWPYQNLCLLAEWLAKPVEATDELSPNAWAIAHNIVDNDKMEPPRNIRQVADELSERINLFRLAMAKDIDVYNKLTSLIDLTIDQDIRSFRNNQNKPVEFDATWQKIWCSLFAVTLVQPVADKLLAEQLVFTIRQLTLLARLVDPEAGHLPEKRQSEAIASAFAATPVLPAGLFPLPEPSGGEGQILPIAVGTMNRVQLQPLEYRLGEIAAVDNIMKGGTGSRSHRRITDLTSVSADESDMREAAYRSLNDSQDGNSTTKTWQKPGYTKTETFDKNGLSSTIVFKPYVAQKSVSQSNEGDDPTHLNQKQLRQFTKNITMRTRENLRARRRRSASRQNQEREERDESQVVDNLTGSEHLVGIYRWIDKAYRATLRGDGDYLLLEVAIPTPARSLLCRLLSAAGEYHGTVLAPNQLTPPIDNPKDINEKNIAQLRDQYRVEALPPAPAETRILTASFDGRLASGNQLLEVPSGYQATSAYVSLAPADLKVTGFIGDNQIAAPTPGTAIPLDKLTGQLDCFFWIKPGQDAADQDVPELINLTIVCQRGDALLTGWQIEAFELIYAAYRGLSESYRTGVKQAFARQNFIGKDHGQATQSLELKKAILRQLLPPVRINNFLASNWR